MLTNRWFYKHLNKKIIQVCLTREREREGREREREKQLNDSLTWWVPIATAVHDDTEASIYERVKESNFPFIAISVK